VLQKDKFIEELKGKLAFQEAMNSNEINKFRSQVERERNLHSQLANDQALNLENIQNRQ
jgi:hypothetical protein